MCILHVCDPSDWCLSSRTSMAGHFSALTPMVLWLEQPCCIRSDTHVSRQKGISTITCCKGGYEDKHTTEQTTPIMMAVVKMLSTGASRPSDEENMSVAACFSCSEGQTSLDAGELFESIGILCLWVQLMVDTSNITFLFCLAKMQNKSWQAWLWITSLNTHHGCGLCAEISTWDEKHNLRFTWWLVENACTITSTSIVQDACRETDTSLCFYTIIECGKVICGAWPGFSMLEVLYHVWGCSKSINLAATHVHRWITFKNRTCHQLQNGAGLGQ